MKGSSIYPQIRNGHIGYRDKVLNTTRFSGLWSMELEPRKKNAGWLEIKGKSTKEKKQKKSKKKKMSSK